MSRSRTGSRPETGGDDPPADLSLDEARRLALAAQGFDRPRPRGRVDVLTHVRRHSPAAVDEVPDPDGGVWQRDWWGWRPALRRETGRETRWEWFQWLAERMAEREFERAPVPAHVAHRTWKEC